MNLLICGVTELGYMVAQRLYQERSVTMIDDLEIFPKNSTILISVLSVATVQMLTHWKGLM